MGLRPLPSALSPKASRPLSMASFFPKLTFRLFLMRYTRIVSGTTRKYYHVVALG